jgi:hypothetical protein
MKIITIGDTTYLRYKHYKNRHIYLVLKFNTTQCWFELYDVKYSLYNLIKKIKEDAKENNINKTEKNLFT